MHPRILRLALQTLKHAFHRNKPADAAYAMYHDASNLRRDNPVEYARWCGFNHQQILHAPLFLSDR